MAKRFKTEIVTVKKEFEAIEIESEEIKSDIINELKTGGKSF